MLNETNKSDIIQKKYEELVDFMYEIRRICKKHNMALVANSGSISVDRVTQKDGWEFIGDIDEISHHGSIDSMINFIDGEQYGEEV